MMSGNFEFTIICDIFRTNYNMKRAELPIVFVLKRD